MPDHYQSVPTVQSSSFYRQYYSRVVLPQLLSRTANPRGTDFYRRYYTGVVLPELLDHPILVRKAAIASYNRYIESLPYVSWSEVADMWDVDEEFFWETHSPRG